MGGTIAQLPIGRQVSLPGHFDLPVTLESARPLDKGFECRVRLHDGTLDEAVITEQEAAALAGSSQDADSKTPLANADHLRLLVESARIRLAYAHDRQFAVSLSGIRTLPHQIEAVYIRMLPQPRLRFLLADDPGAGKTIMAGLLIKEMKLREAIDRVLILCPSPLTIQWQDEMLRWFGESFDIIFSAVDQQQLTNPWQRSNQVIASIDYAKQDEVRERVWQQRWDLIIIDEAHKCSAYTKKSSSRGDEAEKTKRYQLAEHLTAQPAGHVLLLTATPHHGDDDRFAHFIRLLDPDLFPEPHRSPGKAGELRREILSLGPDCPWALRRLKEDLKDLQGHRLFPDRHAHTITFRLNREEYDLYKAVTAYINEFLPQASGRKKASVALVRTVLQRRLASSTMAIFESIRRRLEKQQELLEELESLTPAQRARRLAQLQGRLDDAEQEEDDLDEAERDQLTDGLTDAIELDQLRSEIAALKELLARARRVRDQGADSKLTALHACLKRAEFQELTDGRGKLLIFTEHRDTLNHLRHHLEKWGYTVTEIHGGMNPHERKRAQEEFRTTKQICVATEAAGEGINLQFCRLMINYDLPWNGDEVPAERFLTEVETVVLEAILARLSKEVGGKGTSLAGLDPATRFYILWRYTYSAAELEAGEAIIFANGTHVELDGQHSLTSDNHPLVSKKKSKYALSDFAQRGEDEHLGLPSNAGQVAPLVDVLHRTLWLMEKRPTELPAFLRDSQVNREQLRLVAQALAGPALKGGELGDVSPTAELSALGKLTANWQGVVENAALTPGQREEKKVGQKQLI